MLVAKAGEGKGGARLVEQEPLLTTRGWQAVAERALEHVEQLPRNSGTGGENEKHVVRFKGIAEPNKMSAGIDCLGGSHAQFYAHKDGVCIGSTVCRKMDCEVVCRSFDNWEKLYRKTGPLC